MYEPVIGLEIHAELKTKTKMFCDSLNDPDEKHPNVNICPVCMGHPGTLPVVNKDAVYKVIKVGLALNGEIPDYSQFDRKNYFYPDLPKGYQISQYEYPLVKGGHLDIEITNHKQITNKSQIQNSNNQNTKRVRIRRIHLEEDTGRLAHDAKRAESLVDFNRAGIPLMELVTEPDFRSGEEVRRFGEELQLILRYLGASDADMQKGEMRVEVNISLREIRGSSQISTRINADTIGDNQRVDQRESAILGTKVEIKNINSFRFAEDAVNYEIKRQTEILERGEKILQETRGWDENKKETFSQRSKEEAHDYRYFPEPDLPPLKILRELVEKIKAEIPELPQAKRERFMSEYLLDEKTAEIFIREKNLANYFEKVVSEVREWQAATPEKSTKPIIKLVANYITGDFLGLLYDTSTPVEETLITPENFGELVTYVAEDKISSAAAKNVLEEMFRTGFDPSQIIQEKNLEQLSESGELELAAKRAIDLNPKAVEDYQKGSLNAVQHLVGQVMKETKGRANPKIAQKILHEILNSKS